MAATIERNLETNHQQTSCRTAKVCEHMTDSGREAFKRLRSNVMIALANAQQKKTYVVGVTGVQAADGTSSVCTNMAYSIAELGKNVLIIDCNMRRPGIHEIVGEKLVPGLSDVLKGEANLRDALAHYKPEEGQTTFDFLPGGNIPENPSELLSSGKFYDLIAEVSQAYDYVILDLPPVGPVIDAVMVTQYTDGLLVVVRESHCPAFILNDCVEQLRYAKANILGFVMNGCVEGAGKHRQYGKRNAYHYEK